MPTALKSCWAEPRAPHPPARVWRDWVLVAVLVPTAIAEGLLRPNVVWRPVVLVLAVALVFTLLWRRTHPFAAFATVFAAWNALDLIAFATGHGASVGLYTMVYVLILLYSLLRWGSGRDIVLGMAIALFAYVFGVAGAWTGVGDAIAAFVFMAFPVVLGALVRYVSTSRLRAMDQVRLREREQLARELHDTVAHHVSAMVIRAQAGRVVAATRPEAALEALAVIEAEGSRTLAEMRTMVGALRDRAEADLAPQGGVADIERLARSMGDEPRVVVQLTGDFADLRPSVGAALYRIAQESITNAVRHARHATRIVVLVTEDEHWVQLSVQDDGDVASSAWATTGYGVVGMRERAALLGGTLEVGPGPERGWLVNAVLPRVASAR